ncbi:MAG: hypothetical protein ACRDCE_12495 [Cetobacterium sp.]|uniref:hypothetical protein n=1 Tax=Cetobacterium sp. TaxID=2071632 RepID=UPI003EE525E2
MLKMISVESGVKPVSIETEDKLKEFLDANHGSHLYQELVPKIRKANSLWWGYDPLEIEINHELLMVYAESEQELEEIIAGLADDI